MKKITLISLLAAASMATVSGCSLQKETGDLADQAEEVLAFDLSIDDYIPSALKLENFTDDSLETDTAYDLGVNPLRSDDEVTMGAQLSEFQWAYQGVRDHLVGLEKVREKKEAMIDAMRGMTPFKRGGVFKNVINNIDYEVVIANGFTSLNVNFDFGNYVINQGTDINGESFYQGSYTNPYGGVIAFYATEDSLRISLNPIRTDVNTFLSFSKDETTIEGELVRYYVDTETDAITVVNSGVASFQPDYTYVMYDVNNELDVAKDFNEIEVYQTVDGQFLFSRQQYEYEEETYDVYSYPLTQLTGFDNVTVQTQWNHGLVPTYYVDEIAFPSFIDVLDGTSMYGLTVRGKYRFIPRNDALISKKLDYFFLNVLASEETVNGLPVPFSFIDENLVNAKLGIESLISQHDELLDSLTLDYLYVEVLVAPEVIEDASNDDELISSSVTFSEPIPSFTSGIEVDSSLS